MTDLDAFLQNIRLYAPGVADPAAFFAIRQAAIEFCERTKLWRFDDEFKVAGHESDALVSAQDSAIHLIEAVWFNGAELTPKTPEQLDDLMPGWRGGGNNLPTGQPAYVTQTEPNSIALVPRSAGRVKVALFLKPAQDAETVPDFLAEQHRETIAHGALARLLLIPNQSFTNPEMGAAFGMSFQQRLDGKAMSGSTGQQRARVRTKASFF